MNIELAKKYLFEFINALPKLFDGIKVEYEFGEGRPFIGDDSIENFRGMLGGHSLAFKSGIYIFTTKDNDIIYIGKATKNNLHSRTTSHVGTPKRLDNGKMTFPLTTFSGCSDLELSKDIQDGQIRLHVFSVSDAVVISLIEVYLQTVYVQNSKEGKLRWLNKQIG